MRRALRLTDCIICNTSFLPGSASLLQSPVVKSLDSVLHKSLHQSASTIEQACQASKAKQIDPKAARDQDSVSRARVQDYPVVRKSSTVPASRIARAMHYGGLAASLGLGALKEGFRRPFDPAASPFINEANVKRLVATLSKMRGPALKLGQFLSIQDSKALPPQLIAILDELQKTADYMPFRQAELVLRDSFGSNWREHFRVFDEVPIAAASIGQVHTAILSTGEKVAVKLQFPGVARSITSDLANLKLLLTASALLPKGLYLDNTIKVLQRELLDECNYIREGEACRKFQRLLHHDTFFDIPDVYSHLTSNSVLTCRYMEGLRFADSPSMTQKQRDKIGTEILRLCLQELFVFRFMQTDPNWGNFLWNGTTSKVALIDFGASRDFSQEFATKFYNLLQSAVNRQRQQCIEYSIDIGYLTGQEDPIMVDAHISSIFAIAEPFTTDYYDFSSQTVTERVRKQIPLMLRHRLTPPPNETYSLNRKLSGSFLLCAKLGSRVACRDVLESIRLH